ncbi:molybdopterin-binding protein [Thaumasiovibrio sp. DFM-14]|uniref:molybdopterin-binding protein n=1 Tax=Thaumasiovibrio sp. DFM-14 TaxID=3384792 RepID=UPI0039A0C0E0
MKVAMLSTGDEVLNGDIVDTNAAWFSQRCFEQGLAVSRRVTVADDLEVIREELISLSHSCDVVVVNGGLGPTSDDLSAQAAAEAGGVALVLSETWLKKLKDYYKQLGRPMPDTNVKQAMLPDGAAVIDNPIGTACGFHQRLNGADLYFTPGVPSEFYRMIDEQILPRLLANDHQAQHCHRIYTFGSSESGIGARLSSIVVPTGLAIGYRSYLPYIEVKITGNPAHDGYLPLCRAIEDALACNIVGINRALPEEVCDAFEHSGLTLSLAEQFTAGQLSATVHLDRATVPYLRQGWILKAGLEQITTDAEPVVAAIAMARSSREKTGADVGIANGTYIDGSVAIGLSCAEGDAGFLVRSVRQRKITEMRTVITALSMDILRRLLYAQPLVGEYEWLEIEKEVYLDS